MIDRIPHLTRVARGVRNAAVGMIASHPTSGGGRSRWFLGFLCLLPLAVSAAPPVPARPVVTCRATGPMALADCLDRVSAGGVVSLSPGSYVLAKPLSITKPVTIQSLDVPEAAARCAAAGNARCASIILSARPPFPRPGQMPIEVTAPHVTFSHIRVVGLRGRDTVFDQKTCRGAARPAGGGVRVSATDFTLVGAVLRDVACATAMEVTTGSDRLTVRNSYFGFNGNHAAQEMWADGLTIHDLADGVVTDNVFVDNTDVQLIFGGCVRCTIRGNRFAHTGGKAGSSFAELMLHSWPASSGNYTGAVTSDNRIDCGVAHACGFGLMVGSTPWYAGRTFGGTIRNNIVRNAMMGLNVDGLTGAVTITGNRIDGSGGLFPAMCGKRQWPATNIAPASARWLRGNQALAGRIPTGGCILNYGPA